MSNRLTKVQKQVIGLMLEHPEYYLTPSYHGAHQGWVYTRKPEDRPNGVNLIERVYQSTFDALIATGGFTEVSKGQWELTQNLTQED